MSPAASARNRRKDLQDETLVDASIDLERAIIPTSGIGVSISGYRQTFVTVGYATWSGGTALSTWRDFGKTTALVSAGLNRLVGDERLLLFADRRREWSLSGSLAVTLRRFTVHGFPPQVRVAAERNWSTVGLYAYHRRVGEIRVTRAF